jgi:hypothetical protein
MAVVIGSSVGEPMVPPRAPSFTLSHDPTGAWALAGHSPASPKGGNQCPVAEKAD